MQASGGRTVERAVEVFAAINCIAFGMSHVLQPTAWAHFFIWLRTKGYPGVFVNGMLTLALGSLVVSFHNIWTGIPAALTVLGWAQVVKGLICLWVPAL